MASFTGRGVPDVAGNADPQTGYDVLVDGVESAVGGTSVVAPLYAALVAQLNESLGVRCGFLNPFIYSTKSRLSRADGCWVRAETVSLVAD